MARVRYSSNFRNLVVDKNVRALLQFFFGIAHGNACMHAAASRTGEPT
jgi:hypothetical protein